MTTEEIERAKALADAATPGPWRWRPDTNIGKEEHHGSIADQHDDGASYIAKMEEDGPSPDADAAFIAVARTLVPQLCDEVLRLRAENEHLRHAARDYFDLFESREIQGLLAFAAMRGIGRVSKEESDKGQATRDAMRAVLGTK